MKKSQVEGRKKVVKKRKKPLNMAKVFAVFFIAYFAYTFWQQQIELNEYNNKIAIYENEIQAKQNLIEYYNEQSENITSDEYIESVAREKLGLVRSYETVYVDANN